ncbi:MAG: SPFH domain-containing protein [Pirellula sp.]|nr:SPFH domain-containing protein [Pirellula sp.]
MFRLEVIDYIDQSNQSLIARVPESGTAAIQFGAQLIVQQNQEAIFFRDGRAMDAFGPGRHTLTTANLPVIGKLLTIPFERSPFQACVYFVGKQTFIDQRWGTRTPITVRDPHFGVVRLKGYGKFAYRITDGALLLNSIVGTQGKFTTEEVLNYLRDVILAGLTDLIATSGIGLLDLPSRMDDISAAARIKLGDQFSKHGLELTEFFISSISAPEEVQKAIDARTSMAVLGDLNSYTAYSTANALRAAGEAGMNSPLGLGLGMAIPQLLNQANAGLAPNAGGNAFAANTTAAPAGNLSSGAPSGSSKLDFSGARVPAKTDLQAALKSLGESLGWGIQQSDSNRLVISVSLSSSRRQRVYVELDRTDDHGNPVVGIWSPCGAINPASALTVLRNNDSVVHGAFAMKRLDSGEVLVLKSNVLASLTNTAELAKLISSIAWQADEVEHQLSGGEDTL